MCLFICRFIDALLGKLCARNLWQRIKGYRAKYLCGPDGYLKVDGSEYMVNHGSLGC